MSNCIKISQDVILYKGSFYCNKPEKVYIHNRLNIPYTFKNINMIPNNELRDIIEYDKTVLFTSTFHHNMGHLLWDSMYPSWYGLFFSDEDNWNKDFQWITLHNMYEMYNDGWHKDILEKFSGNKITTTQILSNKYNKPLRIKLLICGLKNLGINCINKKICVNKSFKTHIYDPIEAFIDRMYIRYKIKRNKYNESNNITNIIYINNKRPYKGINMLFTKLNVIYKNKYTFKCIDWSKYTFEEQLKILNTVRIIICGVGTARINSPFIPNGSVEIQTNHHKNKYPNYISFFDCHIGTISNYLKVFNINNYTEYECNNYLVSNKLLSLIEKTLKITPYKKPLNIEGNLPVNINNIKMYISDRNFIKWRNSDSNDVGQVLLTIPSYYNIYV